jgi:hypothetical protein
MYEAMKQRLGAVITARQAELAAAQNAISAAEARLTQAQAAVPSAQQRVTDAAQALAAADAAVATALAGQASAQAAVGAAEQAVADWADGEPPPILPNHKPNPAWRAWQQRGASLRARLAAAQRAQSNASAAVAQAQAARNQARSGLAVAQAGLASALAAVRGAQAGLVTAHTAADTAQRRLAEAQAERTGLDDRERRILADPLDVSDLREAADDELALIEALRRHRKTSRDQRWRHQQARAAALAAADRAADDLAALLATMRAWDGFPGVPALTSAAAQLDALLAGVAAQRARPPESRTDDLARETAQADAARAVLDSVLTSGTATRDQALADLQQAAAAMAGLNTEAPLT